ncbi:hypothetical protein [Halobaculum gomorrense]|uniref:Uncharacterized protein n=1 Tax=Halobaculum gomorrense TaxID=43928 RepID=A0A1M5RBL7_9EURY|nr:hypothetical protein [Halobaculum gomorrense]SHH23744.1 hypothetical protein SAMN05443636_2132 [Halobaculum gomorrense]
MPSPLPIVYLHTSNGGGIRGSIRFQKLVFLAQEESEIPKNYQFVPYKFGPYSYRLEQDIEEWRRREHIDRNRTKNSSGNYRVDYSLKPDGVKAAIDLQKVDGFKRVFDEAEKINSEYGQERLSDLLEYVYRKYPQYTDESTLDIKRLFDESTTSQFTEEDTSQIGPFSHINKVDQREGKVAGLDTSFVRQLLEIGNEFQATLERISDTSLSIYWRSETPSFDSFMRALERDEMVTANSMTEIRSTESEDWIRGKYGELSDSVTRETCQFIRVTAEESSYVISWESGRVLDNDEITIFVKESDADYRELRSALVQYATATGLDTEITPLDRMSTADELITESFRQTAKFAIS